MPLGSQKLSKVFKYMLLAPACHLHAPKCRFEVCGYVQSSLLQEQYYVWINILHERILSFLQQLQVWAELCILKGGQQPRPILHQHMDTRMANH